MITGGPKTGKTTLAATFGLPVRHCDDLISLGWSESSQRASLWFDEPGPWVVEGVIAPRALRKWLAKKRGNPCDKVIWLTTPRAKLKQGHASMTMGLETIWREVEPMLISRGVEIEYR